MKGKPLKNKNTDSDVVNIVEASAVNFEKREQIHFQNTSTPQRTPKINIKDLTEEGNNYEVSFFNQIKTEKTNKKNECILEINEDECENTFITPKDVQIESEETTTVEYDEPPPKKDQYWFTRFFRTFFSCCSL